MNFEDFSKLIEYATKYSESNEDYAKRKKGQLNWLGSTPSPVTEQKEAFEKTKETYSTETK